MAIIARCGSCGKQFQAEAHLAGKTVACPSCGGQLTVPRAAAPAATGRARPAPAVQAASPAGPAPAAPGAVEQVVACRCGARFQAAGTLAGKTVRCPTCQQPLRIPVPRPARAPTRAGTPPPPPQDDFWDALLPQDQPATVVAAPPAPAEESLTGPRATAAAIEQLSRGLAPNAVRRELVARGVSQVEADRVVESLVPESRGKPRGAERSSGAKNMLVGGAVCFLGLAVTVGSYVAAEPGGVFLLAYGPIIFGGLQFLRGMIQLVTGKS